MSGEDLGPWEPLTLARTIDTFEGFSGRWWVTGGRALELHIGRTWRKHGDVDVGVLRCDVAMLHDHLSRWDGHVAAAGALRPWAGAPLHEARHENNLWFRRDEAAPWSLDVTISEGDDEYWVYRRDPSVRWPWAAAVLDAPAGVPYLAPELQLLFKSRDARPKDHQDAIEVIPSLSRSRQARLAQLLSPRHPWRELMGESGA
ncbi:MAG TPA: hypothetical protein VHK88_10500 [Aquihabitans sp.]|nr:hypothetical protein [Aquihabitans sp.]